MALRAPQGVREAPPPVEGRLDGDGCAWWTVDRQEVALTGLLCVVPQDLGQIPCETRRE